MDGSPSRTLAILKMEGAMHLTGRSVRVFFTSIQALAVPILVATQLLAVDTPDRDAFLGRIAPPIAEGAFAERVDPFSGTLTLNMVDVRLPGKAGLDLVIQRYYASNIWDRVDFPSRHVPFYDPADHLGGAGWQLHMGKVVRPDGIGSPTPDARQNPMVILADGSTHALYNSQQFLGEKITRERWRFKATGTNIWQLTTTDGLVYTFGSSYTDSHQVQVAQCTQIRDLNNNAIAITYSGTQITSITDTYGRIVTFTYFPSSSRIQYVKVVNGITPVQTWEYRYVSQGTLSQDYMYREVWALTEVVPPAGPKWSFTYYDATRVPADGKLALSKVTYPTGGTVQYEYAQQRFDTGTQACDVPFAAMWRRTTGGRGITAGIWSWAYSNAGKEGATTTVTGPSGSGYSEEYTFHGWETYNTVYGNIWRVGLPKQRKLTLSGQVTTEMLTWALANAVPGMAGSRLSSDYMQTTNWVGCGSYRYWQGIQPVTNTTITRTVARGSKSYTTTSSQFDDYGNPQQISETGDVTRTTSLEWWYTTPTDTKNLLAGKPKKNVSTPGDAAFYQRDALGRVTKEIRNGNAPTYDTGGLVTEFTYDSAGNLYSLKDGRGNFTYYLSYTYGVPTQVSRPDGSKVYRQVGFLGLIEKETDGRGSYVGQPGTTSYTYDGLGRPTQISLYQDGPPYPGPITFAYAADGSTADATRGTYVRTTSYDGLGRLTRTSDTLNHVEQRTLNALGLMTQRTLSFGGLAGDTFNYDTLGRPTTVVHSDGKTITYTYSATTSDVTVRNERGYNTKYAYQAFGDPDDRRLSRVTDPYNQATAYSYNATNAKLASADAPGTAGDRSFTYFPSGLLSAETHPEVGATSYQYDGAGNMTSRTKPGSVTTTFTYDAVNRLKTVDYAGTTPDVEIAYDGAGNRTLVATGPAGARATEIALTYDGKGWLKTRVQKVGTLSFSTSYSFDASGNLQTITYPSGRTVTYAYNSGFQVTGVTGTVPASTTYASSIGYHGSGKMASISYANNVATTFGYDNRFRLSTINGGPTGSLLKVTLGYDDASNLTSWTDGLNAAWSKTFGYDFVDRLTTGSIGASTSFGFAYDALGNRTSATTNGVTTAQTYDGANRLVGFNGGTGSFLYDGRGNRTKGPGGGTLTSASPIGSAAVDSELAAVGLLPEGQDDWPSVEEPGSSAQRPRRLVGLTARAGDGRITLRWMRPSDTRTKTIRIVRREDSFPLSPDDGEVVYEGTDAAWADCGLVNGTLYFYSAFALDNDGRASWEATASATPSVDLLAFFDFEDPVSYATAVDISGHGRALVASGIRATGGVRGSGVRADGTLGLSDAPDLDARHDALTVEGWYWIDKTGENPLLTLGEHELRVEHDGHLALVSGLSRSPSAATISAKVWHHVVATAAAHELHLYVDGREETTCPAERVFSLADITLPGASGGGIDEVRMYSRALSASEAKEHFMSETYILVAQPGIGSQLSDESGRRHDGNLDGARWVTSGTGGVLDLELAGAFASVPYSGDFEPSPDGTTIDLWLRARGPQAGVQLLAGRDTFAVILSDGKPAIHLRAGGRALLLEAAESIGIATWHHVAAVRGRDGVLRLYVDGRQAATSGPFPLPDESDEGLFFGGIAGHADMSFNGELRGLTVWQRGLAPGEVRQRFQETPGRR
jgi:YD repeat-containing protein